VVPLHTYKFVATLQHKLGNKVDTPLFARIEAKAGHGAGKSLTKQIQETADVYGFIAKSMDIKWIP